MQNKHSKSLYIHRLFYKPLSKEYSHYFSAFLLLHAVENRTELSSIIGNNSITDSKNIYESFRILIPAEFWFIIFLSSYLLGILSLQYVLLVEMKHKYPFGLFGLKTALFFLSSVFITGITTNRLIGVAVFLILVRYI